MGARRGWFRRDAAALALLALLAVVVGGSCGGSWAAPTAPARFARTDLETIVLSADDAPAGTSYVGVVSGFQDLGTFARDAQELGHLREDGFVVGHLALFFPRSHTDGSAPLTTRSVIVQGITGLFRTAAGARSALVRFVGDLRDRQIPAATEVITGPLGDQGFGLAGDTPDGSHVVIFAWRLDNLVLAVSGSGPIGRATVRRLVSLVNERADALG
jgi:hypothetical protein